jgi:hypothetical protein
MSPAQDRSGASGPEAPLDQIGRRRLGVVMQSGDPERAVAGPSQLDEQRSAPIPSNGGDGDDGRRLDMLLVAPTLQTPALHAPALPLLASTLLAVVLLATTLLATTSFAPTLLARLRVALVSCGMSNWVTAMSSSLVTTIPRCQTTNSIDRRRCVNSDHPASGQAPNPSQPRQKNATSRRMD